MMSKEKEVLQGAPSAQVPQACDVCGRDRCDWDGDDEQPERCWRPPGDALPDESDCYRLGYERLRAESEKHEGCIDEMRKDFDLTLDQQLDRAEAAEKRVAELEQALRNIYEAQGWRKLVP